MAQMAQGVRRMPSAFVDRRTRAFGRLLLSDGGWHGAKSVPARRIGGGMAASLLVLVCHGWVRAGEMPPENRNVESSLSNTALCRLYLGW